MHLSRKLFHACGMGIVGAYYWGGLDRSLVAILLWLSVAMLLSIDLIRALVPAAQERFQAAFRVLLDPKDERGLNGSTLYLGGCAFAVSLFPIAPACAGILALALGDPAAAIVGSRVNSPRWRRVSLAGSAACLVAATLSCALFYAWPAALLGGATAAVLEAFSGAKLDNLTIPIGVSTVLFLL
jgi:dolichol kinase